MRGGAWDTVTRALPCSTDRRPPRPGQLLDAYPSVLLSPYRTDSSRVHMRFSVQLYRAAQSRSTQWCAGVECSRYHRMVASGSYTLVSTEI